MTTTAAARLRATLSEPGVVQAPGVFDAVTARLATRAGFAALHLSGAVTSAVALGLPDLGYLHGTDVADLARRIALSTDVPVIADADTGYGNALHVRRTVEQYSRVGLAGLHEPRRRGGWWLALNSHWRRREGLTTAHQQWPADRAEQPGDGAHRSTPEHVVCRWR